MTWLPGSTAGLPSTKNPRYANGLASFDPGVDCAAANNGLKRRRFGSSQERVQVCAGIGSELQHQSHSPGRDAKAIRVRKMLCHRAAIGSGNWESDERDIRNKT